MDDIQTGDLYHRMYVAGYRKALTEVADTLDKPRVVWWSRVDGPLVSFDEEQMTKEPLTDWLRSLAERMV